MTEETATRKSGKERQSEISEFGWKKQNHIFVPFLKISSTRGCDPAVAIGVMNSKNKAKNELLLQTKKVTVTQSLRPSSKIITENVLGNFQRPLMHFLGECLPPPLPPPHTPPPLVLTPAAQRFLDSAGAGAVAPVALRASSVMTGSPAKSVTRMYFPK